MIVASGTKVAIGDNLAEALTTLITDSASKIEFVNKEDREQVIKAVIKANKNLRESLDAKDWEMIGSDLERLQGLIEQLEKLEAENNNDSQESNSIFDDFIFKIEE